MRAILKKLLEHYGDIITSSPVNDLTVYEKLKIYENRAELYVALFDDIERTFTIIREAVHGWLGSHGAEPGLYGRVDLMLALDMALCPRKGNPSSEFHQFEGNAEAIICSMEAMDLPDLSHFSGHSCLKVDYPGGVGTVLKDPDGGSWMRGNWTSVKSGERTGDIVRILEPGYGL
jgi:hypothetical protein